MVCVKYNNCYYIRIGEYYEFYIKEIQLLIELVLKGISSNQICLLYGCIKKRAIHHKLL